MKSNKGFSLVELIVVIAIMAIIAGVAIPVYTGYIAKANDSNNVQKVADFAYATELACLEYATTVSYTAATTESVSITFAGDKAAVAAKQAATVVGIELTENATTVEIEFEPALSSDATGDVDEALERLDKFATPDGE